LVSDAAASTVGADPTALEVVLDDAELVGGADAAGEALELEALLLPQPAASANAPIMMTAAEMRRAEDARKGIVSL
jgi:hypothetical protein